MTAEELSDYLKRFSIHERRNETESWDSYFMRLAYQVRERSSCHHRKVGALIVRENRILSTGYNQPPSGFPHCDEIYLPARIRRYVTPLMLNKTHCLKRRNSESRLMDPLYTLLIALAPSAPD